MSPDGTTALVLSGGGSKGAYAVGALRHMARGLGLSFDFISGTSTGALIAPLAAIGEIEALVRIYSSVTTEDVLVRRRLSDAVRARSLYDVRPLWSLIRRELDEERAARILSSSVRMALATASLQTGRVTYFHTGRGVTPPGDGDARRIEDRDALTRAVLASAMEPVLMPPVRIPPEGEPVRQYVDGGVREFTPLAIAIENGATEIYAVILAPERREVREERFDDLAEILVRTTGVLVEDVSENDLRTARRVNAALRYLAVLRERIGDRFGLDRPALDELLDVPGVSNPFAGARRIALHVIRPETELPAETLEFDPEVMREMMEMGRRRAEEVLPPV